MADAKEICVEAAAVAVLSESDGFFTLKEEQKTSLATFPGGQIVFAFLLTGFDKNFV